MLRLTLINVAITNLVDFFYKQNNKFLILISF